MSEYFLITRKHFSILLFAIVFFSLFLVGAAIAQSGDGVCNCYVLARSTVYSVTGEECRISQFSNKTFWPIGTGVKILRKDVTQHFVKSLKAVGGNPSICYSWATVVQLQDNPVYDYVEMTGIPYRPLSSKLTDFANDEFTITEGNCGDFDPSINVVDEDFGSISINLSCAFQSPVAEEEKEGSLEFEVEAAALNPLGLSGQGGVQTLIGRAIKIVMGIIGTLGLMMFVAGGIMWMTSRGNAERSATAMKMLTWSSLGIIVILTSYIIVEFIFSAF